MTANHETNSADLGFTYQATKDGRVRVFWRGKIATELAGKNAARFLQRVEAADFATAQLAMAKATGNFKRGNERTPARS